VQRGTDPVPHPHEAGRLSMTATTNQACGWCRDPYCAGDHSADGAADYDATTPEAQGKDGTEGKTEKGVVFKHHAGTDTATARGATRKNGGAAILKARGWYWLNSVQAYVIKDQYVAPGTAAQEVREAAEVLRASGLTVEADDVR